MKKCHDVLRINLILGLGLAVGLAVGLALALLRTQMAFCHSRG